MRRALITAPLLLASSATGWATPSTNMWAPSTAALQPYGVMHVTYDTYFYSEGVYPIDAGLEIGALPHKKLQAEVGFDLLYPTFSAGEGLAAPFFLNAKIGTPEGGLWD